ncbi:MAG: hypothetical protein EBR82_79500 [Caulobacteraceae bacterium]|nr:hypothetical protein [Caulobacteraceae bacterium]
MNLFQILASDNSTVRAAFSSAGALTVTPSAGNALTVNGAASAVGLQVKANATTPGNLQEWQDSGANIITSISSSGQIGVRSSGGYNGSLFVSTNIASGTGATVRGVSSQTGDLQQWQSSSATVLGGRNALAQTWSGSTSPVTVATGGAATGASSGTTATITTASAHGLAAGDLVTVASMSVSGYNGTFLVATVPSTTTFTYTTSGSNIGAGTGGTVSVPAQASFTARSAGTVGLVVKAAASPVANIQEWRDNSSTNALAYMSSGGDFRSTTFSTLGANVRLGEASSGGFLRLNRMTAAASNPGSNLGSLYLRDGTNSGTLKLVIRAGSAGAETTILDNIPQT